MANGWMDSGIPMNTTLSNDRYWNGYQWVSGGNDGFSSPSFSDAAFGDVGFSGISSSDTSMSSSSTSAPSNSPIGAALGAFGESMALGAGPLGAGALGIGAGINSALGLDSSFGIQGLASAVATAFGGPLAGAAVGMFGGFATNAIADALDARDNEQTKDMAEDAYGHGLTGLSVGKGMADAVNAAVASGAGFGGVGLAGAQAAADHGLAGTVAGAFGAAAAAQNDSFGPDAVSMGTMSPSETAAISGMGVLSGLAQTGLVGQDSMSMAAEAADAAAAQAAAATAAAADASAATAATGAANAGTTGTAAADSAGLLQGSYRRGGGDAGGGGNGDGGGDGADGGEGDGGGGDSDGGDGDGGGDGE